MTTEAKGPRWSFTDSLGVFLFPVYIAGAILYLLDVIPPAATGAVAVALLLAALGLDAVGLISAVRWNIHGTRVPSGLFLLPFAGYLAVLAQAPLSWWMKTGLSVILVGWNALIHGVAPGIHRQFFNGRTDLHRAVIRDDVGAVRACLAAGADPNAQDRVGETPLYIAADQNRKEALHLLIAAGGDMDVPNRLGVTPKRIARWRQDHRG